MLILKKWDNVDQGLSHLDISQKRRKAFENIFIKQIAEKIDLNDKTIIDYGCGGGWYANLFKNRGVKKYTGLDISDRSIEFARKNISDKKISFEKVGVCEFFKNHKADILVSLACIQHFPTGHYLNRFLESVNNANFEYVILQYRYNSFSGLTMFRENPYTETKDIIYACYTTSDYIAERLTNYQMIEKNKDVGKALIDYVYFRRKNV